MASASSLRADPTQANRDRYLRLLRYIWLPDGRNFAEIMIAEGYGFEYTYELPYRYQDRFREAQRQAREQGRGLWAPGACPGTPDRDTPAPPAPALPPAPGEPRGSPEFSAAYPCRPGQIKGNRNSGIYHVPSGAHYGRTYKNVECFDSERQAQASGYRRAMQ